MLQIFRAAATVVLFCLLLLMVACHSDEGLKKSLAEKDAQITALKADNEQLKRDADDARAMPKCGTVACKDGTCYGIQRGDTLTGISFRFYGTAKRYDLLAVTNGISNPNLIYAGACICIPAPIKKISAKWNMQKIQQRQEPRLDASGTKPRPKHSDSPISLRSNPLDEYLRSFSAPSVTPVSPLIDMPRPKEEVRPLYLSPKPRNGKAPDPASPPKKAPDSLMQLIPAFNSGTGPLMIVASHMIPKRAPPYPHGLDYHRGFYSPCRRVFAPLSIFLYD